MRLSKTILPLLFLLNFGYSQDWKLSEKDYVIKHRGQDYHSKLAKRGYEVCYYIYKIDENGGEETIGDDTGEIQDYKDLALASHFNLNKDKILQKINSDLEMFKSSNKYYKIGKILNKAIEELTELNTKLLLRAGSIREDVKIELIKDYSIKIKKISENFIEDIIKDIDRINSLDDLVKKLEEKIFNSTVTEAKENIKRLESGKRILSRNKALSTKEIKLAEKIISESTIKGYSISTFQNTYMENIDEIGYQLTNIGSSMLKSFPEGERVYYFIKKLGINGIEEIDSEAIKKSLKKMREVHERIMLSMTLYKKDFDPSLTGSSANSLIKELNKRIEESLSNLEFIIGKGVFGIYGESKPVGHYSVEITKDSNSVTFGINSDKELVTYGWADLKLDFKKLNKNIEFKIDATPIYFNQNLFYSIGVTDGRAVRIDPQITSFADYRLIKENKYAGMITWNVRLPGNGKISITRSGESSERYKNRYNFDVNDLNRWIIRIVAYTRSSKESKAKIKFDKIKARTY